MKYEVIGFLLLMMSILLVNIAIQYAPLLGCVRAVLIGGSGVILGLLAFELKKVNAGTAPPH
jgi:hypothetical protein